MATQGPIKEDSINIFDEFIQSEKLGDEVRKMDDMQKKDMYFYLKKLNLGLFTLNVIIFISIVFFAVYIYFQSSLELKGYSFLEPICGLILGKKEIGEGSCYPVTAMLAEYVKKEEEEKLKQTSKIFPLIGEKYSIENYNTSKKVSFLLEKKETRLRPLEILAEFDAIKSKFVSRDKSILACYNIVINENLLSITCDALSSDWDSDIITLSEGGNQTVLKSGGTSISRASSFINYIEKIPNSPFTVLEKTTNLRSETIQVPSYTQKTTIQLKLLYSRVESDLNY